MIFDRYRVMNLPQPRVAPAQVPVYPRPMLGRAQLQAVSAALGDASQVLAEAQKNFRNVSASYAKLTAILGQERANQAVAEAQASLDAAQAEVDALAGGA